MNRIFLEWRVKLILSIAITILFEVLLLNYVNAQRAVSLCFACANVGKYGSLLKVCSCGVSSSGLALEIMLMTLVPLILSYLVLSFIIKGKKPRRR